MDPVPRHRTVGGRKTENGGAQRDGCRTRRRTRPAGETSRPLVGVACSGVRGRRDVLRSRAVDARRPVRWV